MARLIDFVIFVFVVGLLWWVLGEILAYLAVPAPFDKLAVIAFILIAVLSFIDYIRSGRWFWTRP